MKEKETKLKELQESLKIIKLETTNYNSEDAVNQVGFFISGHPQSPSPHNNNMAALKYF